jgi:hypothetical protein
MQRSFSMHVGHPAVRAYRATLDIFQGIRFYAAVLLRWTAVYTENLISVDDAMESPKLAE